ncbi:hypothetical protein [Oscillospiraceae bacterium]|nr:hypothetical protein [Oscillospiraceae bacterium]
MSAYTGFLTHFPCAETEDFRKFCRGGRLCPPAEKSRFYENLRRIRTAKGRKAASVPTKGKAGRQAVFRLWETY